MATPAAMKVHLEAEQAEVRAQIADLEQRLETKPDYGLGAGDPAVYQWEFNLAMRNQALDRLRAVESALGRLTDGTYGACSGCGGAIEAERLEVLPSTTLCSRCAQARR
jgi:RNA polymerase-binding transcription factor DksA